MLSLRWVARVLGFVLADDPESEQPYIPSCFLATPSAEAEAVAALSALEDLLRADLLRLQTRGRDTAFDGLTLDLLRTWRRIARSFVAADVSEYEQMDLAGSGVLLFYYGWGGAVAGSSNNISSGTAGQGQKGKEVVRLLLLHSAIALSLHSVRFPDQS